MCIRDRFHSVVPLDEKELTKIGVEKKDKLRREAAMKAAEKLYAKKEKELGEELIRGVEREVYLQILDTLWMQHLENMQHLREGIHWRSVGPVSYTHLDVYKRQQTSQSFVLTTRISSTKQRRVSCVLLLRR